MKKFVKKVKEKINKEFGHLKVIGWIFGLLWRGSDRKEIYNGLTLAVFQSLLIMLPPAILTELNNVLFHKPSWFSVQLMKFMPEQAVLLSLGVAIAYAWYKAFDYFNRYTFYSRKMTDATQAKFQHEAFAGMLYQELPFHKQNRAAGIQSQVRDTSKSIYLFLYSDLTVKAISPLINIPMFAIFISWWINPVLILVSIFPFFYVLFLCFTIAPKIAKAEHKSWNVVGETATYCLNRLQNYRIVKMFRNEQYEIETAWKNFQEQLDAQLDSNVNWRKLTNKAKRIGAVFMAVFVSYITLGSEWGWYSLGIIVSAVWYYIRMFDSFIDLCFTYNSANRLAPQLAKIEPFLIESKVRQESSQVVERLEFKDSIEFKNVQFTHPPRSEDDAPTKALHGINCQFFCGQATVVAGKNGSGKSTMIDLLCGMDKPESGTIYFDGVDTRDYSDEGYAKVFAAAWQKTMMFDGTIWSNLVYARPDISADEVYEVASRVGIHDTIMALPKQYQTVLGDVNDHGLSGGQMQRLQIVRALLANRQVLILDEPTAGLDAEGIQMIWGLVRDQTDAGRTVVMISHQQQDLALADRVIFIQDGLVTKEEARIIRSGLTLN